MEKVIWKYPALQPSHMELTTGNHHLKTPLWKGIFSPLCKSEVHLHVSV